MIIKSLTIILSLIILSSCVQQDKKANQETTAKVYSDFCAPMIYAYIKNITIEIQGNEIKSYSITERQEINDFIFDIENSKVNGPWKGSKWDKIVLLYEDGYEKVFNTNGEVFGQGSSGTFFDLNDKYNHYWKK
jgi:hypothetical protein